MTRMGWKAAAIALAGITGQAQAADLSPTDIVNRHMAAAAKHDVDAMVADYADDAVTIVGAKSTQGKAAIRQQFAGMFGPRPATAAATPAPPAMQVQRVWQEGDVGFVSWTQGPVQGTDAFLVRNGKILVQAVFIGGPPRP